LTKKYLDKFKIELWNQPLLRLIFYYISLFIGFSIISILSLDKLKIKVYNLIT
jgi:hypothetical protein